MEPKQIGYVYYIYDAEKYNSLAYYAFAFPSEKEFRDWIARDSNLTSKDRLDHRLYSIIRDSLKEPNMDLITKSPVERHIYGPIRQRTKDQNFTIDSFENASHDSFLINQDESYFTGADPFETPKVGTNSHNLADNNWFHEHLIPSAFMFAYKKPIEKKIEQSLEAKEDNWKKNNRY